MIRGKYHGNTGYLLGNVDAGTQEFAETGIRVDEGQTRQTDKSQMMTSRWGRTSESHKRIAQSKMTSLPRMELTNEALGCSRATRVLMEYLRLVNLTEICPSRIGWTLQSSLLTLWMDENSNQQSNKNC